MVETGREVAIPLHSEEWSILATHFMRKSKSLRKVFRKTPGAITVIHYKKKLPTKPKCAYCGTELQGTLRLTPAELKRTPKTKKRPQRPYGGVLCSKCSRLELKQLARELE